MDAFGNVYKLFTNIKIWVNVQHEICIISKFIENFGKQTKGKKRNNH